MIFMCVYVCVCIFFIILHIIAQSGSVIIFYATRIDPIKRGSTTVCWRVYLYLLKCSGQKRELLVLFWPKTGVPEKNSGRECCGYI